MEYTFTIRNRLANLRQENVDYWKPNLVEWKNEEFLEDHRETDDKEPFVAV